ncbi:MAG: hypothetical protein ABH842_05295 [Candidatus Micrarchaeota archaeon]
MKGQYFSFDAIIASVIFVLALVALLSYWHSVRSFLDYQNDPMSKEAVRVSNLLFTPPTFTTGLPSICPNMERLGLAFDWTDRRIDPDLVDCAESNNGNPTWLNEKLSTPYTLTLVMSNVSDASQFISIGTAPTDPLHVVKIRRLGTVLANDGTTYLVNLDLSLYKE